MRAQVPHGALGEAAESWRSQMRVSIAHIMRVGKVGRTTYRLIVNGTTAHPGDDTLRRIADGLAADPRTQEIDARLATTILRDLRAAAGYVPLGGAAGTSLLRLALSSKVRTEAQIDAWVELIERHRRLPAEVVMTLTPRRDTEN